MDWHVTHVDSHTDLPFYKSQKTSRSHCLLTVFFFFWFDLGISCFVWECWSESVTGCLKGTFKKKKSNHEFVSLRLFCRAAMIRAIRAHFCNHQKNLYWEKDAGIPLKTFNKLQCEKRILQLLPYTPACFSQQKSTVKLQKLKLNMQMNC